MQHVMIKQLFCEIITLIACSMIFRVSAKLQIYISIRRSLYMLMFRKMCEPWNLVPANITWFQHRCFNCNMPAYWDKMDVKIMVLFSHNGCTGKQTEHAHALTSSYYFTHLLLGRLPHFISHILQVKSAMCKL